jgi:hypothetical protein
MMVFSQAKNVNKTELCESGKMPQVGKKAAMDLYGKIILIICNLLDAKVADLLLETYLRSDAANISTRSLT